MAGVSWRSGLLEVRAAGGVVMPGCTEQNWESHLAGAFTLVNHGSFKLFRDRMRDRLTFCNNLYLFHFHLRFCLKLKIE